MRYHVLFDRTERLFSKGQKALAGRNSEAAVRHLEAAIATDPEYPHLYMYLGIAKAELGLLEDGSSSIRKAMELDPQNFVFPLELGVRHLDAGEPMVARGFFIEAAALAPENALVANYARLVSWEIGDGDIKEILAEIKDIPTSFRARFLLRLLERLIKRGQLASAIEDPLTAESMTEAGSRPSWLAIWWRRRILRVARQRIDRGDVDGAFRRLLSLADSQGDSDVAQMLSEAREKVLQRTQRELENSETQEPGWVETVWRRMTGGGSSQIRASADRRRRALLLDVAQLQLDLGQTDDAYVTLENWVSAFKASGRPLNEGSVAAASLVAMARIDNLRGEHASSVDLCVEAREYGHAKGIDWIEGVGRLAGGDHRSARHLFEDHLRNPGPSFESAIQRLVRLLVMIVAGLFLFGG